MSEELNIQEAAILASNMRKKLKAFEKIEEVVNAAATAQTVMDQHTDQLKIVQADIAKQEARLSGLKDQSAEAQEDLNDQLRKNERALEEVSIRAQASIAAMEKDAQAKLSKLHIQIEESQKDLDLYKEQARAKKASLQQEIDTLQGQLENLRQQAASMAGV